MSQKPDPTDLIRAAPRSPKFGLKARPTDFTTSATKPTLRPASQSPPPATLVAGMPGGVPKNDFEIVEQIRDQQLAMPGLAAAALADNIDAVVLEYFHARVNRLYLDALTQRIAGRFLTIRPGRDRFSHMCLFAHVHFERTFARWVARRTERPTRVFMNALHRDPGDVAGKILNGKIPWPSE